MDESKLTPWFDGRVKPIRRGVYMQHCAGSSKTIGYQLWDGIKWRTWSETPQGAARSTSRARVSCQNDPWRGLKEKP
jgi:hypothetical protein